MPELRIEKVEYEAVAKWRSPAARDHVALGPTSNTTWWGAFRGDVMVGVAGLIRVGRTARVKGVFVPRAYRGDGIGTELTEAVIASAPANTAVEVFAYNPAFYQGRGFDLKSQTRPGVSRLVFRGGR